MKDVPLQTVLKAIEGQSEFFFLYSSKMIDVTQKVDVKLESKTLSAVLDKLFENKDIKYEIRNRQVLLFNKEAEPIPLIQQQLVSGKVTDASTGQAMPGVNIQVKGTTIGAITDVDGIYTISVTEKNVTLIFSFIGYVTQEIQLAGKTTIDAALIGEVTGLDEVVVVGYGTQKKASLTASVDRVDKETLENRPVKSVSEALQSTAPGLYVTTVNGAPQSELKLNIRGFTGFGTEGSPLVLVDGVERQLSDINTADVENISILKDAAASAIYGSRAPFGVILVTTKSGQKGQGIKVNYNGNFGLGTPAWMPHMLDSWVHAERFNSFYRNTLQAPQYADDAIQRMKDYAAGVIKDTDIDVNGTWGGHWTCNANNDWFKILTRRIIPSQQHNLSFSGGNDNTTYYMGLGYNESTGIFAGLGDNKDRYSALLKLNTDATKWLNLNLGMNYIKTAEKGPSYNTQGRNYDVIFNWISRTWPNWPTYYPNGTPYVSSIYEPLLGKTGMETFDRGDLNITGGFKVAPLKGWDITGNYTFNILNGNYVLTSFPLLYYQPTGAMAYSARATKQAQVLKQMSDNIYQTVNLFTSYTKEFSNHFFNILIGYQQETNKFNKLTGQRLDLFTNDIPSLTLATGSMTLSDNLEHWATQGYFGRFSYNYAEKYLFEFNGRYDAHSKFPKAIRWAFFPSFSMAWNIAKESFWPITNITNFKIRGSFTNSGDNGTGNYLYLAPMTTGVGLSDVILGGQKPSMVFMPSLVSNHLTWAKPRTIGVGVDMTALNNRLEVMLDWYQRTIFDQAGPAEPMPATLGTTAPKTNNAVSETRGWEISAKWKDEGFSIAGKPFDYNVQFRLSDYIGYVVKYEQNITGSRSVWTPGQVFGKNYLYESAGIAQSVEEIENNVTQGTAWYYPGDLMLKDLNGDGKIDTGEGNYWYSMGDVVGNGYNYPRYRYGITLGADWNGIDFSALLEGVGHWRVYSGSAWLFGATDQWNGGWFKEHEELGTWTPETPNAFYPRKSFSTKNTSRENDQYSVNLAHLKIRNIRLGYNLPKSLINKISIDRLYIYTSLENLGYIFYKSWIKYDPEIIDNYNGQGYPTQRIISFGLNLGF